MFLNDATPRTLTPLTPTSPCPPIDCGAILLEDDDKGSFENSRFSKARDGQDAQNAIEIPDSQDDCFSLGT
jgi:hypothetical protein